MSEQDERSLIGARASLTATVTDQMTAVALGSGDVPVLGTPMVLALLERAAVQAVQARLDPGLTTVGVSVELRHLAPTPVGPVVRAEATVVSADGRRLMFEVRLSDDAGPVAEGTHARMIVDRERFLAGASERLH